MSLPLSVAPCFRRHLERLISNGDAMEIHGPVSLPHGGQRLRMMSSVHAQDTVCPVIEANGEIPHLGTVEKTWNFHPFGLPGAWLELSIGPAHAQNSLEVRSDLQAVIVHQKQTLQLAPSISTIFAGAKPPRTST